MIFYILGVMIILYLAVKLLIKLIKNYRTELSYC
jgi:hypothetical protein